MKFNGTTESVNSRPIVDPLPIVMEVNEGATLTLDVNGSDPDNIAFPTIVAAAEQ